jgi:tetratricopeptide (TPR) repeat protein
MKRYLVAGLMVGLLTVFAVGQQAEQADGRNAQQASAGAPQSETDFPGKPELLRGIALYEAAVQQAEAAHSTDRILATTYLHLGWMYECLGMYPRGEEVMRRAISILRSGPESELAGAISDLASLHVAMNELRAGEKEELEALRIREKVGDRRAIAYSWNHLAVLYLERRQYKKAVEFGQRAMDVIGDDPSADVLDRIGVRFTLAKSLCRTRECGRAIPLLQQGIELAKSNFGTDGLPVGCGYFLLGYAYWQSGDMDGAAEWMERGITQMKVKLGWGQPTYLVALTEYAEFLRKRGRKEDAMAVEREVRQAEAVVDVRALATRSGVFGLAGTR